MKRIFTFTLALIISVAALADNKEDLTKLNEIIANPNTTEEVRGRAINKAVEIIEGAEFGIHGVIVPNRIVGTERSLAIDLPDGMKRHQPYGINAQLPQTGQMPLGCRQRTFRSQLPDIHLIQNGRIAPCRMGNRVRIAHFVVFSYQFEVQK